MRRTPKVLTFASLILGAISLCALSLGVSTDFWLFTEETTTSKMGNMTFDRIVTMRSGLWRMCLIHEDLPPFCSPIDYFKQDSERPDDATISVAITRAIRISAPMQVGALLFAVLGFILGVVGGIKQDGRTIAAAVMYIFSGLLVAVGMILYISSVNDEEGYGIKSKEGPAFSYRYGWSFVFVGISFVCCKLAAVISISLYVSLNTHREDILRIVPGLEDKLQLDVNIYTETDDETGFKMLQSATHIY